jgi:hypothetical protein
MARSYADYERHLVRYGPDGILDAAKRDLTEQEYSDLEKLVAAAQPKKKRRK